MGYKPNCMKTLLEEKAYNKRRSFHPRTSTLERQQMVIISKCTFLQQYRFITDENLMEKGVHLKNGTKAFITDFGRKIYSDNFRALHRKFYATQTENVSFSVFYTQAYYVSKPTEKKKESCMCINCLNPHLLLKLINTYRKSITLQEYQSLTTCVNELKVDGDNYDLFPETKGEKEVCYYAYERKLEC